MAPLARTRVGTEVTFGRGDLIVCPLGGFPGAQEYLIISVWILTALISRMPGFAQTGRRQIPGSRQDLALNAPASAK